MTDTMEEDLMDAMNAALEEEEDTYENPSISGHSLQSVDVMDEAMNLLFSDGGEIGADGDAGVEDNEEEIDFNNFLKTPSDRMKAEENERDESPTSATSGETAESKESKEETPKANHESKKTDDGKKGIFGTNMFKREKKEVPREEPQVVPVKQFENALALIQDLENRIQVLETDQQCLLEENEQLRETCNKQATTVAEMEAKLHDFPKLLEQTVQEEATLAASQAAVETKNSFWRKDMARQEAEYKEEQRRKQRAGKHAATTESLKQSDFLQEVVELKEKKGETGTTLKSKKPNGIFQAFRGWGNRMNNNSNKDKDNDSTLNGSEVDVPTISKEAASEDLKHFSEDEGSVGETNDGFDDSGDHSSALDLMT